MSSPTLSSASSSGIIYALVSRGSQILAEHSTTTGNFHQITQTILSKIPPNNSKLTYVYDRYLFHYISENGLVFLCMADDKFGRRIPFAFLQDTMERFVSAYTDEDIRDATPLGLNGFSRVLARQMDYYSRSSDDAIRQVRGEISQVKDVMVQNIERVLERGDRIDLLVDKSYGLSNAAFAFRKRSTALKRQYWWRNQRLLALVVFAAVVFVYLIISSACGFPTWSKCRT
ncbi:vesicle-associated membrane protein [Kickxella alabastrina]|uniref:vesicle-associated membrane protein n=1 Tax=Kickxella alabastrina TaxID=61397 RepID=UPI0022202153|nr:vesicle-associated membrane protein [Kickxella alabastrina]KAI7834200.1 vesicle-associated membrane protein [Kickxella alabastrina]